MSFYDKVRGQKFLSSTVMIFTLSIGILIGTIAQTGAKAAREQATAPDATPLTTPNAVVMQNEFTKVAKLLEPSVVNISAEYIPKVTAHTNAPQARGNSRRMQRQQDGDDDDSNGGGNMPDFLQRFFGQQGGGGGMQFGEPEEQRSGSLGSGVIVDRNGYILTNNHVVDKATRITVKFMSDDTEYPATVIGTDKDTDLAVIHVDKKNLPAAHIGNSDALQPGDWSVAIGSPFGFQATVTAGIISAIARDVPGGEATTFQHFIQTDAAINPGNSGGPLANINGEVIGINTMIASRSGGYQGIGFAMPMNTAVKVYNQIIRSGHVTRGSIGIQFPADDGTSQHTALLKVYGADHGVFVKEVEPNGPAEKSGLKEEDVITAINGHNITKGQDLIDLVADSPVGSTLKANVIRNKKPMMLDIVVGDRTKIFPAQYGGVKAEPDDNGPEPTAAQMKFGMSVQALRPGERQSMNFKKDGGVLVASVEPGSFADDITLQKGDVIVEMNRQPVNAPEDIRKIQGTLKAGDAVVFHVWTQTQGQRGGGNWVSRFASGTVPAQ